MESLKEPVIRNGHPSWCLELETAVLLDAKPRFYSLSGSTLCLGSLPSACLLQYASCPFWAPCVRAREDGGIPVMPQHGCLGSVCAPQLGVRARARLQGRWPGKHPQMCLQSGWLFTCHSKWIVKAQAHSFFLSQLFRLLCMLWKADVLSLWCPGFQEERDKRAALSFFKGILF